MKFKNILKEFLIVALGVFIAMVGNSWNESRKAKIEAQNYLDGIKDEIQDNIKILEEAIPYHQGLLDGLIKDPKSVRLSLNVAQVNNIAWRLAENNTFKNNIDKQLFYKLAKTYQRHDNLTAIQEQAGNMMTELNIMSPYYELQLLNKKVSDEDMMDFKERIMQAWIPVFESWTYYERSYLAELKETLEEL